YGATTVCRVCALDRGLCSQLPLRGRWPVYVVRAVNCVYHDNRGYCRLGQCQNTLATILRGVFNTFRPDGRGICRGRCAALLCLLRGHTHSHVFNHWGVGRSSSSLRSVQVLLVYPVGFVADFGGIYLSVA